MEPKVRKILEGIDQIPVLPEVISKVLTLMKDPKTSMSDLGKTVSMDIALSTKVLKIVNSAFYGLSQKVSSLGKAVSLLGFNTLKSSIISVSIIKAFKKKVNYKEYYHDEFKTFTHDQFWLHCLAVASIARVLARKHTPILAEDAFVAGIIHDIGKMITEQFLHEHYENIVNYVKTEDSLYYEAEQNVMGFTHCDIGGQLAKIWNLPSVLVNAIKHHHKPFDAPEEDRNFVKIVHIADIFARSLQIGSGWDRKIPPLDEKAYYSLGLEIKDVDHIMKLSIEEFTKANAFMEILNE